MPDEGSENLRRLARQLLELQPGPDVRARIRVLGEKAEEGLLTPSEIAEYESFVDLGDLLALLRLKAQRILKENK